MDMGGATQFGRASMRREADREVREARFSSTMDIGAAQLSAGEYEKAPASPSAERQETDRRC